MMPSLRCTKVQSRVRDAILARLPRILSSFLLFLEARLLADCQEVTHTWIEGLPIFVAKAHVKHVCNSLLRAGALRNRMHFGTS
jgi:hypothetical protein